MYHPLPRDWLLATNKIEVAFQSPHGKKSAHGSGFWVRNGETLLFVTNRHMIDLEYKDPKYRGHDYCLSSVEILSFDSSGRSGRLRVIRADILSHENADFDVALMSVKLHENPDAIKVVPATAEIIADVHFIEDQLEWGAQVSFSSFQPWRDTQTERPIVRSGILASDPAHSFVLDEIPLSGVHLIEAFSFAGSSGSPVFANARGIQTDSTITGSTFRPARIIGVMTGHLLNEKSDAGVPHRAHTGLSFCHRSDFLLSMVRGTESLQQSTFDALSK